MARSMTGYGTATHEDGRHRVSVEARAVNHRYLKVQMRLPRRLSALEGELEGVVRRTLRRGAVSLSVDLQDDRPEAVPEIDREAAQALYLQIRELRAELGLDPSLAADPVPLLLQAPGILSEAPAATPGDEEEVRLAVRGAVEQALEALLRAREEEGRHLASALEQLAQGLAAGVDRLAERAPDVPRSQRDRLLERVRTLLEEIDPRAGIEEEDLAREVCALAERSDVTEEIDRLRSHLARFGRILAEEDDVGRPLDFLLQEMLREVNTIGSKANDETIAHLVVDLKTGIERAKEQVQNLE